MSEQETGEYVEAAAQPAQQTEATEAVSATQEEMVPISVVQAERKQRQELQENMRMLQDHLELLKANNKQPKKDEFSDLREDDVLTVGEAKKYISNLQNNYEMSIEELRMQQRHPDYSEVVTKYLPDVLKEDPELQDDIKRAKNPYKLAYKLAKQSDRYREQQKTQQKNEKAERILKNSERSGNLSSVGGTAPINSSKPWKDMTDAEFKQHVSRNMGYVG